MLRRSFGVLLCWLVLLAALPVVAQPASPLLPTSEERAYRLVNRFEIVNTSPYVLEEIKVRVLVGAQSDSPYQRDVSYRVTPTATMTHRDLNGNHYGDLVFPTLRPGEKRTVTIDKFVRNSGVTALPDIYERYSDNTDFYLEPKHRLYVYPAQQIESDAQEIQQLAADFLYIDLPARRAKAIFDYVNTRLEYNENPAYANRGALSGARTGQGVCTEFSGLFVALCRATGIPARVVSGYWQTRPFPDGRNVEEKPYRHAWAEFYLADVGWIPVEPSRLLSIEHVRVPSDASFGNIGPDERHFIWSYGIEPEREGNISISYSYLLPKNTPKPRSANFLAAKLAYEAVELLP